MSANFKTCMFGGFDRQDVVRYIEKTAKETQERIDALEQENEALRAEKEQLEAAMDTLRTQSEQLRQEEFDRDSAQQQLEDAQAQLAALSEENTALAARNEKLRSAAEECRRLKERIADIEISAHRRTEEFRAEAMARLREIIAEQRTWCQERRGQYAVMNERLLCDLRRAEDLLMDGDMSGFDRMMESLQQMEDSLE